MSIPRSTRSIGSRATRARRSSSAPASAIRIAPACRIRSSSRCCARFPRRSARTHRGPRREVRLRRAHGGSGRATTPTSARACRSACTSRPIRSRACRSSSTNCALCHAEKLRWTGGEAFVVGLGNKRVRIHAYDAAFVGDHEARPDSPRRGSLRLADDAAARAEGRVAGSYRDALTARDARSTRAARASARAPRAHARNPPGRVATIESFALVLATAQASRSRTRPTSAGRRSPT